MTFDDLLSLPPFESGHVCPFGAGERLRRQISLYGCAPRLRKFLGKNGPGSIHYRRGGFAAKAEAAAMTIGDCQYGCIAVGRHPVFDGILVRKPRADMRASPAACAG